jgi:hypothetical protein
MPVEWSNVRLIVPFIPISFSKCTDKDLLIERIFLLCGILFESKLLKKSRLRYYL